MREREVRELFEIPRQIDSDMLAKVRQMVSSGLELEKGTPPSFTTERLQIVGVIADTLYETTEYLEIEVPSIGLLYNWNDNKGRITYAGIPAITEKGIIKFSPEFLEGVAMGFSRNGISAKPQRRSLVNITAHEAYHVYQIERFPEQSEIDFENDRKWIKYSIANGEELSFDTIPKSKSERGALMFGRLVENIKSKS